MFLQGPSLQLWALTCGLPHSWDYRCKPPHLGVILTFCLGWPQSASSQSPPPKWQLFFFNLYRVYVIEHKMSFVGSLLQLHFMKGKDQESLRRKITWPNFVLPHFVGEKVAESPSLAFPFGPCLLDTASKVAHRIPTLTSEYFPWFQMSLRLVNMAPPTCSCGISLLLPLSSASAYPSMPSDAELSLTEGYP
jgi:hypothetical protein